jgi:hypothetical protein
LHALDAELDLRASAGKRELERARYGHVLVLAELELVGTHER